MAFTEEEVKKYSKKIEDYIEKIRPKEDLRSKVDISYKIERQSIIIFEIRENMSKKKYESPIAKTTYIHKENIWKIYWMRADSKWHSYEPKEEVKTLDTFIKTVEEDKYCCFWG